MDHAVLVGINAYAPPNTLYGCLNDAADVRLELIYGYAFSPDSIEVVSDQAATAAGIKSALSNAVSKLTTGDRFVFWYSGHGDQLVLGDAATDVICPIDYAASVETSVTVADFHACFSQIPDGVRACWGSDSCHSGDLERGIVTQGTPRRFQRPRPKFPRILTFTTLREIAVALPNIVLLAGCRSDQLSLGGIINGRYNGAFTRFFLNALHKQEGPSTPLQELVRQVQQALTTAHFNQDPQLSGRPEAVSRPFLVD